MGNEITIEEKKKKVRDFRPIDDAFFEVLADDAGFCQEMLRILLDDDDHLRRVRFNASSIAVKDSQMGKNSGKLKISLLYTYQNLIFLMRIE